MKKRSLNLCFLLLYRITYEIIYEKLTSKIFAYSGLDYDPDFRKAILSYIIFFIVLLIPRKKDSVSRYLLDIMLVFTMIPLMSLYWQSNRPTSYFLMCVCCYCLLSVLCCLPDGAAGRRVEAGSYWGKLDLGKTLAVVLVLLFGLFVVTFGLADLRALNLYHVYEVRAERSFSGIWAYLVNWMPYAMIPCLLCISMAEKRWGFAALAVCMQCYFFLFSGSKTALFSVGLIVMSYYFVKKRLDFINCWAMALTLLNGVTTWMYVHLEEVMPFHIFPVRLLTIPASISFRHYVFFSKNQKLHFAENFIGKLFGIQSPYRIFSTYLLGKGGNSNTGYLGDAYDNAGFLCMVAYSLILVLIFRYIDGLYRRAQEKYMPVFVGILTYTMIYLNDGTLTAVILTGGLFINVFVLRQLGKKAGEYT